MTIYQPAYSKQELIEELQSLAQDNPDREITRAFFRTQSGFRDSVWEPHFGSWIAFRAAAGLEKTKVQRKLYTNIGKHAENDILREFNDNKQGWEGAYLKPSNKRFQSILCGSDFHDKLCDPFTRNIFVDTAKRLQPDKIVLAGDVLDLYEFSNYAKDPRVVDLPAAFKWKDDFLFDLREAAPDAEIIWTAGNHEERLIKMLANTAPMLMPLLSDIHGMTIADLFGLQKHEVNFISKANLATFNESDMKKELAKNYYIAYEAVLFHHYPYAKKYGLPGVNGHHHSFKVEQQFNALTGPYLWVQGAAGHIRVASYCEAEKWANGFTICHVDTLKKGVQFEICDTTHDVACVGGKYYARGEEEILRL